MARQPAWCDGAEATPLTAGIDVVQQITENPALLVGILLRAGAVAQLVRVFNQRSGPIDVTQSKGFAFAGINLFDGWVNQPVKCLAGIIATRDQITGEAIVYWTALPPE